MFVSTVGSFQKKGVEHGDRGYQGGWVPRGPRPRRQTHGALSEQYQLHRQATVNLLYTELGTKVNMFFRRNEVRGALGR